MKKLAVFVDFQKFEYFVLNIEESDIVAYATENKLSYVESVPKAKEQITREKAYRELIKNSKPFSFKDEGHIEWNKLVKIYKRQNEWAKSLLTDEDRKWAKERNKTPLDIRREQNAWAREHIREFGEE